jgi:F-type H+-transporting ATPase subunit epsilon
MTELGIGELTYHSASAHRVGSLAIIHGFAEVVPDRVTILAETAERAEEIDVARAEAARERAEKRLAEGGHEVDWDRATVALQRALIRIQVGTKKRSALVPGA